MKDKSLFLLDEVNRAMLGEVVMYRYRCLRCHHEDDVPDLVIDGFLASAESALKPGEKARLEIPNCDGPEKCFLVTLIFQELCQQARFSNATSTE